MAKMQTVCRRIEAAIKNPRLFAQMSVQFLDSGSLRDELAGPEDLSEADFDFQTLL